MFHFQPNTLRKTSVLLLVMASVQPWAVQAQDNQPATGKLTAVKVEALEEKNASEETESYTVISTPSATGLNLSLRDTPQAASVITQQVIQDQAMDSISDALRSATGISVKAVDRGRNSLSARGFDISNYQLDGVPTVTGNIGLENASTVIYDRVEIVRGSTGLLNGSGDPSATVNLVRKRANSENFAGNVELTLGSWDQRGGTIDLGSALVSDGSVRARFIAHREEADSFIDLENTENTVLYTIVDADLGDSTRFSIGGSDERTERNGIYWGGLPIWFADGTRTHWKRSKTTATHWNQWDTKEQNVFTTLDHSFANNWTLRANASFYRQDEDSNLLWVWGEPDKTTGEGMSAYPYLYGAAPKQSQFGLMASGPFSLFGRDHEISRWVDAQQT